MKVCFRLLLHLCAVAVRALADRQLCRLGAQGGMAESGVRHRSFGSLYDLYLECRRAHERVSLAGCLRRHHRLPRMARGDITGTGN